MALGMLALAVPLSTRASAAETQSQDMTFLVSSDAAGKQISGRAVTPIVADSGRFVAFTNVTGGGAATKSSVMLKNLTSGAIETVSVTNGGVPVSGTVAGISADGQRIAFTSSAPVLDDDVNDLVDLYVRDRKARTTTRVNLDGRAAHPVSPNVDGAAAISGDGRTVAWQSEGHLLVRSLVTGKVTTADTNASGFLGNAPALFPRLDAAGTAVVFESAATNLSPADPNPRSDVYRRDLASESLALVSTNNAGIVGNGSSTRPSVSADGRVVAFTSAASNLVGGDTNGVEDVFAKQVGTVGTERMSIGNGQAQAQANDSSGSAAISGDGLTVSFHSLASNLVAGDGNDTLDVFTHSRLTQATTRASSPALVAPHQLALAASHAGTLDHSGTVVAFTSADTGLVGGGTAPGELAFVRMPEPLGLHPSLSSFANQRAADFQLPAPAAASMLTDLKGGRINTSQAIVRAAHSAPFATDREPVTRLFFAFFKRMPDPSGLEFWRKRHATGTSLSKIAAEFAKSSEFKTKYGKVANADFVRLVFLNVLDRPADAGGLAFWTSKLNSGTSRGDVMTSFSESSEGKRHLAPSVDTVLIGLGVLHHLPSTVQFLELQSEAVFEGNSETIALLLLLTSQA